MSVKTERMASNLVKEISYILNVEVKNKDIGFITITDVKLQDDLSFAKVYYTILEEDKKESTEKALNSALGFIRHELRDRVQMRQIPELRFVYDTSGAYSEKIEDIIEQIHEKDKDLSNNE